MSGNGGTETAETAETDADKAEKAQEVINTQAVIDSEVEVEADYLIVKIVVYIIFLIVSSIWLYKKYDKMGVAISIFIQLMMWAIYGISMRSDYVVDQASVQTKVFNASQVADQAEINDMPDDTDEEKKTKADRQASYESRTKIQDGSEVRSTDREWFTWTKAIPLFAMMIMVVFIWIKFKGDRTSIMGVDVTLKEDRKEIMVGAVVSFILFYTVVMYLIQDYGEVDDASDKNAGRVKAAEDALDAARLAKETATDKDGIMAAETEIKAAQLLLIDAEKAEGTSLLGYFFMVVPIIVFLALSYITISNDKSRNYIIHNKKISLSIVAVLAVISIVYISFFYAETKFDTKTIRFSSSDDDEEELTEFYFPNTKDTEVNGSRYLNWYYYIGATIVGLILVTLGKNTGIHLISQYIGVLSFLPLAMFGGWAASNKEDSELDDDESVGPSSVGGLILPADYYVYLMKGTNGIEWDDDEYKFDDKLRTVIRTLVFTTIIGVSCFVISSELFKMNLADSFIACIAFIVCVFPAISKFIVHECVFTDKDINGYTWPKIFRLAMSLDTGHSGPKTWKYVFRKWGGLMLIIFLFLSSMVTKFIMSKSA